MLENRVREQSESVREGKGETEFVAFHLCLLIFSFFNLFFQKLRQFNFLVSLF
ncbi:hypothetical protein Lalb_Chr05g0211761 [Lupinus albus]|uniref:Uncharacterized protein n=1 Tax=Lupinus albus TaxID=3870 RepID=A0A6A4QHB7_LUPAL|nr:hypothetical protein Lalb_Chr05g0211761 [Lupinus albus]